MDSSLKENKLSFSSNTFPELKGENKVTDEAIIHRRLMFDGDMNESYINLLQKLITKWVLTDHKSNKGCENMYKQILLALNNVRMNRQKSELKRQRIEKDAKFYTIFQKSFEEQMISINNAITVSTQLLKEVRKHSEQNKHANAIICELSNYPSVQRLSLNKTKEQIELKNLTQIHQRALILRQKIDNQILVLVNEVDKCTKDIKQLTT